MSIGHYLRFDAAKVEEFFDYAGYKARDQREPLGRIGDLLRGHTAAALLSEGDTIGEFWKELTPKYAKWKAENYPAAERLLELRGHLLREVLSEDNVRVTQDYVDYEVPVEYAVYHNEGWANNPVRRFFDPFSNEVEAGIETVYDEWLDDLRRANVRRGAGPGLL